MRLLASCLAIGLGLLSTCAMAGSPNYESKGTRPASGRIETPGYVFDFGNPPGMTDKAEWNYFVDADEPRTVALLAGMKDMDSYALSVTYKGSADGKSTLDAAKKIHPELAFSASTANAACVSTPPDRPIELEREMVSFHAICVDGATRDVYEVGYSWRSIILKFEGLASVTDESRACASRKASCEDYIGSYVAAYRDVLRSLAFVPLKATH